MSSLATQAAMVNGNGRDQTMTKKGAGGGLSEELRFARIALPDPEWVCGDHCTPGLASF